MNKKVNWLPTNKNIKEYILLKQMLAAQRQEFDLLSRKKTNEQLNTTKIKMINRVLIPLKELFKHEESYTFLDTLNEDDIPNNSDVVLIISQYEAAIINFKNRYYLKDKYNLDKWGSGIPRWMTKEFPPNFNK